MKRYDHQEAKGRAREAYNHVRSLGAEVVEGLDPDAVEVTDRERLCLWVSGHFLAKAWHGARHAGEDLPDPATCPADPDYFLPWGPPRRGEARKWYEIVKVSLGTEFARIVPDLLVTLEELHNEEPLLTPEEKEILTGTLTDFLEQGRTVLADRVA